jgi:hypothetical protein
MIFKKFLIPASLVFATSIFTTTASADEAPTPRDVITDTTAADLVVPAEGLYTTDAERCNFRLVLTPGTESTFLISLTNDNCQLAGQLAFFKPAASGEVYIGPFTENGTIYTAQIRPISNSAILLSFYNADGSLNTKEVLYILK